MDSDSNAGVRIAVLIDADNTSAKYAEALLDEVAKYGNPTIKRAYGDWTSQHLSGWSKELNARAIRGMHQNAFTTGKNSTDSALIIDAMDLLYAGNVEAFALVTSDSDFTSLALRLREAGKTVYGLGRQRTPVSLQNACDKFIRLELLGEDPDEEDEASSDEVDSEPTPPFNLQSALTKAINATADEDGWTRLGSIGSHLGRTHAAFDPRMFGHAKLSSLVAAQSYLETAGDNNNLLVRLKGAGRPAAKKTTTATAAKKTAKKAPAKAAKTAEQPKVPKAEPKVTKTASRVTKTQPKAEPVVEAPAPAVKKTVRRTAVKKLSAQGE